MTFCDSVWLFVSLCEFLRVCVTAVFFKIWKNTHFYTKITLVSDWIPAISPMCGANALFCCFKRLSCCVDYFPPRPSNAQNRAVCLHPILHATTAPAPFEVTHAWSFFFSFFLLKAKPNRHHHTKGWIDKPGGGGIDYFRSYAHLWKQWDLNK